MGSSGMSGTSGSGLGIARPQTSKSLVAACATFIALLMAEFSPAIAPSMLDSAPSTVVFEAS